MYIELEAACAISEERYVIVAIEHVERLNVHKMNLLIHSNMVINKLFAAVYIILILRHPCKRITFE